MPRHDKRQDGGLVLGGRQPRRPARPCRVSSCSSPEKICGLTLPVLPQNKHFLGKHGQHQATKKRQHLQAEHRGGFGQGICIQFAGNLTRALAYWRAIRVTEMGKIRGTRNTR